MRKMLEELDKSKVILTIVYRACTYLCWYLFGVIAYMFIKPPFNNTKLISLILAMACAYIIRNLFKYLYKKEANKSYHSIKHTIEMYYFKKLKYINSSKIEELDKDFLGKKIIDVSYNYTKIIYDIGEIVIPLGIGLLILFIGLFKLNFFLGLLVLIALTGLMIHRYIDKHDEQTVTNFNDLLLDYVNKLVTIKKLNIFSFCANELDAEDENDVIVLKDNHTLVDLTFNNLLFAIFGVMTLVIIIIEKSSISALGVILFALIIFYKLKVLLFEFNNFLINFVTARKNKTIVDSYFEDNEVRTYIDMWKKVAIKDGIFKYSNSGMQIKIPNFEFSKGDTIAILGKAGQGKSTILKVLCGLYKLESGTVYYDGDESTDLIEAFYISKDTQLFNLSLRQNLCLGNNIPDEDLIKYIKELDLTAWFNTLPNGLDTIINERVIKIPDSIRQKLNIIRVATVDRELYFFDEATRDVDMDGEKLICDFIKKYLKKKTYIIVTHKTILSGICKKHYFVKEHTLLEKETLL